MSTVDDLATWLLEQIAEDERVAGDLAADGYPKHGVRVLSVEGTLPLPWPDRWNPVLVLRECEAKRQIIHHAIKIVAEVRADSSNVLLYGQHLALQAVLKRFALLYAHLPGYRREWQP